MSRGGRSSSLVNLKMTGGGNNKAGLVNSWNWSQIPRSILASNAGAINDYNNNNNNPENISNLYAWGLNDNGQLGDGTTTNRLIPTLINNTNFKKVVGGEFHSLGLTEDGKIYAWGSNNNGQLGIGTNNAGVVSPSSISIPTLISNIDQSNIVFTDIAAGRLHSLALTNDGKIYSWGRNANGQLGLNNTTTPIVDPTIITTNNLIFKSISAGEVHSLGLTTNGKIYSWGNSANGQLGNGEGLVNLNTLVPTAIRNIEFAYTYIAIACGNNHSVALRDDNTIYACGFNNFGQLGRNNTTSTSIFTLNLTDSNTNFSAATGIYFKSITAGVNFTMGLSTTGKIYSFGTNAQGQLGDNSTTQRTTPVALYDINNLTFKSFSGGNANALGLTTDNKLYVWGRNNINQGQLGINSSLLVTSTIPIQTYYPDILFKYAACGFDHTLALI